jgi:hypothetical protein
MECLCACVSMRLYVHLCVWSGGLGPCVCRGLLTVCPCVCLCVCVSVYIHSGAAGAQDDHSGRHRPGQSAPIAAAARGARQRAMSASTHRQTKRQRERERERERERQREAQRERERESVCVCDVRVGLKGGRTHRQMCTDVRHAPYKDQSKPLRTCSQWDGAVILDEITMYTRIASQVITARSERARAGCVSASRDAARRRQRFPRWRAAV